MGRAFIVASMMLVLSSAMATPMAVVGSSDMIEPPVMEVATVGKPSPEAIATAASERATYGLPADSSTVAALLGSNRDVGSARWGIALTAEEEAALDLPARMAFANALSERVLPFAQSLSTYGGAYIDQQQGGRLVVLLTERDQAVEEELGRRMPSPSLGLHITEVAHSEASLMEALTGARAAWDRIAPAVTLVRVGLDTMNNQLLATVRLTDVSEARAAAMELTRELGVPVAVAAGEEDQDVDCTSRNHCHDPYKAGINIYKGVVDSVPECTMGFHIRIGTDEQFVTAGHCGYSGSNEWYEPVLGRIGIEQATLYVQNGQDIMRLSMFDVQASDDIYAASSDITGSGTPVLNETVCASKGTSNEVDCGTVSVLWMSWTSSTAGYTVWGGDTSGIANIIGGDSGSPIYRNVGSGAIAIGVINTAGGLFARLDTSLDDWAASVVN